MLSASLPQAMQLRCDYTILDAIKHTILWGLITIFTLGLGGFFGGYYINKDIINKTVLVSDTGKVVGHMECPLTFKSMLAHALKWFLITLFTAGIGAIVYMHSLERFMFNNTRIYTATSEQKPTQPSSH